MGWKAAEKLIRHWKVLRGDNVMIIRGKDKGETGVVKRVVRSQNRVIVEGKNLVKKHIKAGEGHEGGIFTVEAPLHASNVQVVDPVTGRPCKVGIRYLEDGTKVRVSRGEGSSGSIIPRPEILKIRATPRPTVAGPKDTPMDLVLKKTYDAKTGKGMPDLSRVAVRWYHDLSAAITQIASGVRVRFLMTCALVRLRLGGCLNSHCDQEAKLLQDNPGRDAHAEQQSSGKPRPCSLLFHNIWKEERKIITVAQYETTLPPLQCIQRTFRPTHQPPSLSVIPHLDTDLNAGHPS
ncbi:hypothetical protein D5086_008258 [Populus alba]|uniref:Uncharacterized protein n=1 Tax=Populus alba TaxID=43335 RepID=A0ACC4CFJ2_POPAL